MKKLLLISLFSLTICLTACGNNAVVEETTTEETTESVVETFEEEKEPESTVEPTVEETIEPTAEPTTESIEEETVIEESATSTPETVIETPNSEAEATDTSKSIPDTSNVNYELPYIVNGIDIRSGDNDGDGITDNHGNTWYDGQVFTASNGIKVRIADGFDVNALVPHWDAIFVDGTENAEPGSPYMVAINEYLGTADKSAISPSDLPQVNTPSSMQTTFNKDDASFQAYKASFDPLWQIQNTGSVGGLSMLQAFDNNHDGVADGVGLLDGLASLGYMWQMNYDASNGCWKLEIYSNYTALIWDSIRNSIRLVSPEGEAVYNAIYELYYYGGDWVADYDGWYPIPNTNSQILVHIEGSTIYYNFK